MIIAATCTLIVFSMFGIAPGYDVATLDMQNRWYVEDWGRVEALAERWPDDKLRCVLMEVLLRHRAGTLNETTVPDRSCPANYEIMNRDFPPVTDPAYLVCNGGLVS
jgi:hypothetical protein